MSRRTLSIPGFSHRNPVPSGCIKNNIVMTGGLSGLDPVTAVLPATLDEQCRNVFQHIRAVMDAAGGRTEDIIKVEFWQADLRDKDALNREWLAMFPDALSRPTRHAYSGDQGFAPEVLIVASLTGVLDA